MNKPIVIIGAGTVGLYLAHELMLKGLEIILIDAGGEEMESFSTDEFENVGHFSNGLSIGRAKGIGGTSNLWGGQLAEFVSEDINRKDAYNQPNWLYSYDSIAKHYSKVYKKLGFKFPVDDKSEVLYSEENKSTLLERFYTLWLKFPNFKSHFYGDLLKSEKVKIYQNQIVKCFRYNGETCIGIELYGQDSIITNFSKIILANGTIEIVRLLLMEQRNSLCPFKENMNIGKFFQDHLNLKIGVVKNPSKQFFSLFSNRIISSEKWQPKLRLRSLDNKFVGVSGYFSFSNQYAQHIDNFKQFVKAVTGRNPNSGGLKGLVKLFFRTLKAIPNVAPLVYRYIVENRIHIPFDSKVNVCIQSQQVSIFDSKISISNTELDSYGRAKVLLDWKIDGREILSIQKFASVLKKHLENENLGEIIFEPWLFNSDSNSSWLKEVTDIYHHSGGAIMGNSNANGVVNTNFKVFNTSNIYLCGACIMPTSSYANTGLTSLALTSMLVQHLTENLNN